MFIASALKTLTIYAYVLLNLLCFISSGVKSSLMYLISCHNFIRKCFLVLSLRFIDYFFPKVLDNSTIGVKHPGVTCQGCCQENIVGFRWQCSDCSKPNNLCTFCFTNEKHNLKHVNFKRYDQPSSDP